jgi:hypothetical protein
LFFTSGCKCFIESDNKPLDILNADPEVGVL